jgi:glycosyltransferase involved in cell wall biosynthesis
VDILGEVPDVRVYLRAAGILLVPIRAGGGTRIKILEAIAAGVPVVSTALGMEGLDLRPEADLLPAEAAADFAHQVVRLAEDVDLRNRITLSAFDQVRARFSIEVLDAALDRSLAPLGFSR